MVNTTWNIPTADPEKSDFDVYLILWRRGNQVTQGSKCQYSNHTDQAYGLRRHLHNEKKQVGILRM
jgi:hypothetical protein